MEVRVKDSVNGSHRGRDKDQPAPSKRRRSLSPPESPSKRRGSRDDRDGKEDNSKGKGSGRPVAHSPEEVCTPLDSHFSKQLSNGKIS